MAKITTSEQICGLAQQSMGRPCASLRLRKAGELTQEVSCKTTAFATGRARHRESGSLLEAGTQHNPVHSVLDQTGVLEGWLHCSTVNLNLSSSVDVLTSRVGRERGLSMQYS